MAVFTIFAPTNEAFSKLQPSFVQQLFLDQTVLKSFLKHHVTSDTVIGPLIKNDELVTALSGIKLRLNSYPGDVSGKEKKEKRREVNEKRKRNSKTKRRHGER